MPLDGGLPVRRTFEGTRATPVGWTTDGRILFSTRADSGLPDERLAFLDARTGAREPVPLAQASEGAWSADGPTLYFTRLPWQGSSTKRYQGGTAENLWRYSFRDPEAVPLTADFKGTSRNPMWWRGRLYFLSDRDGIVNVWSIQADGSDPKPHTHHRDYDVMSASLDNGRIAYQLGADLRLLDLADDSDRLVPIALTSDFDQQRERWIRNRWSISPRRIFHRRAIGSCSPPAARCLWRRWSRVASSRFRARPAFVTAVPASCPTAVARGTLRRGRGVGILQRLPANGLGAARPAHDQRDCIPLRRPPFPGQQLAGVRRQESAAVAPPPRKARNTTRRGVRSRVSHRLCLVA